MAEEEKKKFSIIAFLKMAVEIVIMVIKFFKLDKEDE